MPFLAILLLAVLVAMFGFWDTLQAVLGGVLLFIVLGAVAVSLIVAVIRSLFRPRRRRLFGRRDDRWS